MTLALDPRLPLLWRTPHSLQLGLDDPPVVLLRATTAHERMLAGLAIGLTREGLDLIGTESGLSAEEVAEFESAIRPALAIATTPAITRVYIDGVGPTSDRLKLRLREAGLEPCRLLSASTPNEDAEAHKVAKMTKVAEMATVADVTTVAEFAVIVGDYVLDPERRGYWLRRDIPHLPLIFGDTSVTIGPFIEPGAGPCLYCLELHRTDADPAWPAIASQLLGKSSTAQSPFAASEAATMATRMLLSRVRLGATGGEARPAITVNVDTGETRESLWRAHPQCACAGISVGAPGQDPQENATVSSFPTAGRATQTTTSEAVSVPA